MTGSYHKKDIFFQGKRQCNLEYAVPEGGFLELVLISIGDATSDHVCINLGKNCQCNVYGLYLGTGEDRFSFDIVMHHTAPDSKSQQLIKGILNHSAKTEFRGLVHVDKDAQRTEAYQENHTLLLDDRSRIITSPHLEIYADDVKCSHGASVGHLNDDELFYLRSRGITLNEARELQQIAFLSDILEHIEDKEILQAIYDKLASIQL